MAAYSGPLTTWSQTARASAAARRIRNAAARRPIRRFVAARFTFRAGCRSCPRGPPRRARAHLRRGARCGSSLLRSRSPSAAPRCRSSARCARGPPRRAGGSVAAPRRSRRRLLPATLRAAGSRRLHRRAPKSACGWRLELVAPAPAARSTTSGANRRPQPRRTGARVVVHLARRRADELRGEDPRLRLLATHADRELRRARTAAGAVAQEALHDPVLERMEADDRQPSAGTQHLERRREPDLERLELVVDLDA